MAGWWQDLRLAVRSVRQRPYFSLVIVLTMAIGTGANVGAFAYYSYFARPTLDAPGAKRLVWVYRSLEESPRGFFPESDWRALAETRARLFDRDAAWRFFSGSIEGPDRTIHTFGGAVSGNYFALFGARAHLGRLLGPSDDRPEAEPTLVLSHLTWTRYFDADPEILGRTVYLEGRFPYTVVGVTQRGFQGTGVWAGIYIPLADAARIVVRDPTDENWQVLGLGRLAPGVSKEEASEILTSASSGLDEQKPLERPRSLWLESVEEPALEDYAGEPIYLASQLLVAAMSMLLLLACANVANLMLARGVARRRELGVHVALGAGRFRIARRLFIESLTLSLAGGVLGLGLARGLLRLIEYYLRQEIPVGMGDWGAGTTLIVNETEVGLYFAAVAVATGLFFGMAPVLQMLRLDVVATLKGDALPGDGKRWHARDLLVVTQVALSAMLLIGAALLARTLWKIEAIDLGFDDRGLMLSTLYMPKERLGASSADEGVQLYRQLVDRVESLAEVQSASLVWRVPLSFSSTEHTRVGSGGERMETSFNVVDEGYFDTLGLPLLSGRGFEEGDDANAPDVIVINRTAAQKYWPGKEPLGQTLLFYPNGYEQPFEAKEVVGVVADSLYQVPWRPIDAHVYLPFAQRPFPRVTMMLRAAPTVERPLRDLLRAEYSDMALLGLVPFEEQTNRSMIAQRMNAELSGGVGLLAFFLATLGIFSVMSYTVNQRRRDIGIRIAIGARQRDIKRWVLTGAFQRVAVGLALGLVGAAFLTRLLEGLLIGVDVHDPITFALVPVLLAAGALLAAWLPSRRATRVDPLRVLKEG